MNKLKKWVKERYIYRIHIYSKKIPETLKDKKVASLPTGVARLFYDYVIELPGDSYKKAMEFISAFKMENIDFIVTRKECGDYPKWWSPIPLIAIPAYLLCLVIYLISKAF